MHVYNPSARGVDTGNPRDCQSDGLVETVSSRFKRKEIEKRPDADFASIHTGVHVHAGRHRHHAQTYTTKPQTYHSI